MNIGQEFILKTKYPYLSLSDQSKGVEPPPIELISKSLEEIPLSPLAQLNIPKIDLQQAIENRQSIRKYSNIPLNIDELNFLLYCTQGVKKVINNYVTLRTVPSAGARHAFETYLAINNVSNLNKGLYQYSALKHTLLFLNDDSNIINKVANVCGQQFIASSAVVFIWVAIPYRMNWRYSERGYRYLFLDAGHVCQNLYLAAEAIKCGVCAIAAYNDDGINSLLNIDGENAFVIYIATVGKK